MQQIDTAAIEALGIPRLLLMEHAGLAVASAVRAQFAPSSAPILVCCGNGFNGGDGLAAARHLGAWGYPLRVLVTARLSALREEPATYAAILTRLGISLMEFTSVEALPQIERWAESAPVIIDALLGIGARGRVREPIASLIACLNRSGKPIIAVDVPSGLDADTGAVQGVAVRARTTVTFGLPKQGCFRGEGPSHAGSIIVDPISFPPSLLKASGS